MLVPHFINHRGIQTASKRPCAVMASIVMNVSQGGLTPDMGIHVSENKAFSCRETNVTWPRPHMQPAHEVVSKLNIQVDRQTIGIGKVGRRAIKGRPSLLAGQGVFLITEGLLDPTQSSKHWTRAQ